MNEMNNDRRPDQFSQASEFRKRSADIDAKTLESLYRLLGEKFQYFRPVTPPRRFTMYLKIATRREVEGLLVETLRELHRCRWREEV